MEPEIGIPSSECHRPLLNSETSPEPKNPKPKKPSPEFVNVWKFDCLHVDEEPPTPFPFGDEKTDCQVKTNGNISVPPISHIVHLYFMLCMTKRQSRNELLRKPTNFFKNNFFFQILYFSSAFGKRPARETSFKQKQSNAKFSLGNFPERRFRIAVLSKLVRYRGTFLESLGRINLT